MVYIILCKLSSLLGDFWRIVWKLGKCLFLGVSLFIDTTQGDACVFCFLYDESCGHLFFFFTCLFSYRVCSLIYVWLGFSGVFHYDGINRVLQHGNLFSGKRIWKVRHIVWLAVVWSLWLLRNKIIFQGCVAECTQVVVQIKMVSWGWFICKEGRNSCLFVVYLVVTFVFNELGWSTPYTPYNSFWLSKEERLRCIGCLEQEINSWFWKPLKECLPLGFELEFSSLWGRDAPLDQPLGGSVLDTLW